MRFLARSSARPPARGFAVALSAALLCAALSLGALPARATDRLDARPMRTLSGAAAAPWAKIECWRDQDPHLVREKFLRSTQPRDFYGGGIVDGFGGDLQPPSSEFLLHYAPGWDRRGDRVPILLVPGAGSNATHSFVGPEPGGAGRLMRFLADRGWPVFAITFASSQGDCFFEAEAVADAIRIIRGATGAAKVDLVAHSKGAVVARMLVSDVHAPWGTPFDHTVRHTVLLASPNQGIDFSFRHPVSAALFFHSQGTAFPSPRNFVDWVDPGSAESIFGGVFDGQLQMLRDWSGRYAPLLIEPDAFVAYFGGWGFTGFYPGIQAAIARGDHMIDRLERAGVDPTVDLSLLYGTHQRFDRVTESGVERDAIPGEMDGPSDGLVFVDSLRATAGLTRRGAHLSELKEMSINHAQCVTHPDALAWIAHQLE